jgi:hypothetical protein
VSAELLVDGMAHAPRCSCTTSDNYNTDTTSIRIPDRGRRGDTTEIQRIESQDPNHRWRPPPVRPGVVL